jgi:Cu(I)/Ag(I) efflux system membrane fusion protein
MKPLTYTLAALAAIVAAAYGGYRYAIQSMAHTPPSAPAPAQAGAPIAGHVQPAPDRKILYWHDPMYPQHKFDKPGRSPFMNMDLVPVYADAAAQTGGVEVSARMQQSLGIRTAEAMLGSLEPKMEAVGSVSWNERAVVLVQARAGGFVEKLHARAPLDPVAKGAPLVEILVPEWAGAQEELLLLRRQDSPEAKRLAEAARQRLLLLGMSEEEIRGVEAASAVKSHFTLRAPISGVIAELGVREGMTVMAGATLYRIVDLSTVWVNAEVPEAQASWLVPGAPVEARVPAFPETVFKGKVGAILPELNAATRTLRARIELANPGARLKPGMFANLSLSAGRRKEAVLVPSEAVIRTGARNVVIALQDSRFAPLEVEVGREMEGKSEILKGLKPGMRVVASGQFLIDSEASLKSALGRLQAGPEDAAAPAPAGATHKGSGRVVSVDRAKGTIEIDHGPMPSIKWPAMQMGFMVADRRLLQGLAKGDAVEFEMRAKPDKEGEYVLERLQKARP